MQNLFKLRNRSIIIPLCYRQYQKHRHFNFHFLYAKQTFASSCFDSANPCLRSLASSDCQRGVMSVIYFHSISLSRHRSLLFILSFMLWFTSILYPSDIKWFISIIFLPLSCYGSIPTSCLFNPSVMSWFYLSLMSI